MRLLFAEDQPQLRRSVTKALTAAGYSVDAAADGAQALDDLDGVDYDAIVLDVMMPRVDGLTVLRTLRSRGFSTPVLMLTALDGVPDRVDGLDAGADDYLAKPFAAEELLARIRALSRRPRQWESTSRLSAGDLELDTELAALRGPAGACSLSRREKQLLELFLRNAGQTLTRELLLSRVWGPDAPVEDGNLDNYIHFLRRRLRTVGSAVRLATVRSVGYRLEVGPC